MDIMNVAYAIILVLINYGLDLSGYIHPNSSQVV